MIVDYFREYADALFKHFGSRVKRWITFNEPAVFCGEGYGYGSKAPAILSPGVGDYLCAHHVLIANAEVYRMYKEKYFAEQQGEVGICLNSGFNYPFNSSVDAATTEKAQLFELGKFSHPIFSKEGGYPQIMVDEINRKSRDVEGRPWSRLPIMTDDTRKFILGTADFLALNYYTSRLTLLRQEDPNMKPSWWADTNLDNPVDPSWKRAKSAWLYSVPEGLRDLLRWIRDHYENPTVMITENGWSDDGQIDDVERVEYLKLHLASVAKAIRDDDCKVVAYTVWSLTDNFEWKEGYTERFGIHYINFTSEAKERVPKSSALFFKDLMSTRPKRFEL